jgi:hypothetical protein
MATAYIFLSKTPLSITKLAFFNANNLEIGGFLLKKEREMVRCIP